MSKAITFSTRFPSKHPQVGQPTFFAEKLMASFADVVPNYKMPDEFVQYDWYEYYNCTLPKHHTIRNGNRFKEGEWFNPVIWQLPGGMYKKGNKMLRLSKNDIQIVRVFDFHMLKSGALTIKRNNSTFFTGHLYPGYCIVAKNDGLEPNQFSDWFKVHPKSSDGELSGQVICWNENIDY